MNKMKIITILLVLVISLPFSGCIDEDDDKTPTITALERKKVADKKAQDWKNDSKLTHVKSKGYHDSKGGAEKWIYTYISFSTTKGSETNLTQFKLARIGVNYENSTDFSTTWSTSKDPDIIKNWNIDSDKAVRIAKNNSKIKSYLNKYDGAMDDISLDLDMYSFGRSSDPNSASWFIVWNYEAGFDSPRIARIYIDAQTGDVLWCSIDE